MPEAQTYTEHQHKDATQLKGGMEANHGVGFLSNLTSSQSMDITNDPRFFQDNVLNYRLSAFGGLGVVSGLMVQNSMGQIFAMNKVMNFILGGHHFWKSFDAMCLFVAFVMLVYILFVQMYSIYVGVCQPYCTYRLMTSGQRGFEAAASYYLHPRIVTYRHSCIKAMFSSLPLYLLQMGIRVLVKFDSDTRLSPDLPAKTPWHSQVMGIVFCLLFFLCGFFLIRVHADHTTIFSQVYMDLTLPKTTGDMAQLFRKLNHRESPDV